MMNEKFDFRILEREYVKKKKEFPEKSDWEKWEAAFAHLGLNLSEPVHLYISYRNGADLTNYITFRQEAEDHLVILEEEVQRFDWLSEAPAFCYSSSRWRNALTVRKRKFKLLRD